MKRREFITGLVAGAAAGAVAGAAGRARWERSWSQSSRPSYSQQGEDIVLFHALRDTMKIEKPTYMDVGAAHPKAANNTYLLYATAGGHGVLIEPNPMFVELLRRDRPNDITVAAGIGVTETKEADYYEFKGNPWLNTFSADQVKEKQKEQPDLVVERVTKMPLLNINTVIQEHLGKAPDLLSTDVEGLDFAILQTLDLARFRPAVICSEDVAFWDEGQQTDIAKYLVENGYVPRGGSMVNAIYLDKQRLKG